MESIVLSIILMKTYHLHAKNDFSSAYLMTCVMKIHNSRTEYFPYKGCVMALL